MSTSVFIGDKFCYGLRNTRARIIKGKNMKIIITILAVALFVGSTGTAMASAKDLKRGTSISKVRSILGNPLSIRGPAGTVREYQLWKYEGYMVAFTNNQLSHVFDFSSQSL